MSRSVKESSSAGASDATVWVATVGVSPPPQAAARAINAAAGISRRAPAGLPEALSSLSSGPPARAPAPRGQPVRLPLLRRRRGKRI